MLVLIEEFLQYRKQEVGSQQYQEKKKNSY